VKVAHRLEELPSGERSVAIGSFDGVHRGHRAVLVAAAHAGRPLSVVTFWPHPRLVLGNQVELLSTLSRRLELLDESGVDEVLVVEFTSELAGRSPEEFAESLLRKLGSRVLVVGENFRFGRAASGDPEVLRELGFEVEAVPSVDGISSTRIRELLRDGEVVEAAGLLGHPAEIEGTVVLGDRRGGTLGFPTANLAVPANLLVPGYGIYAGEALGHRAAVSIGINPHYGGHERRVEPHLLDFDGDLYGQDVRVELWERLRDERAFSSEAELVAQIAKDVERTRAARRPV
jgi:riboflavin kinase/FMN adenylyltransferase